MNRITTDNPQTNTEMLMNLAYAKDGKAFLRHAGWAENIDLCEYVAGLSDKMCDAGTSLTYEDVMDGICLECEPCPLGLLYYVAVQAAELRARLKRYEDAGIVVPVEAGEESR